MTNKIIEMTQKAIDYATLNGTVLVRIDSQFNYNTYKWTVNGFGADGTKFDIDEELHVGITK